MTVHAIPADHLDAARNGVLVVDGDTETCHICDGYHCHMHGGLGWGDSHPPAEFVKLTEPCEQCMGRGWDVVRPILGDDAVFCPACDGSGRPWLTINVECGRCLPDARGYEMTGGAEWKLPDGRWVRTCYECSDPERWASPGTGVTTSFRAHVLDAVRILRDDERPTSYPFICRSRAGHGGWVLHHISKAKAVRDPITLPPGEHVGRYAVLIEPEES